MSTPDSVHPAVLLPVIRRLARRRRRALSRRVSRDAAAGRRRTAGLVAIQTVAFFGSRSPGGESQLRLLRRFDRLPHGVSGALSFLSIVADRSGDRTRPRGGLARHADVERRGCGRRRRSCVGAAYLHLILWGTRVMAAAFAASSARAERAVPAEHVLVGLRPPDTPHMVWTGRSIG